MPSARWLHLMKGPLVFLSCRFDNDDFLSLLGAQELRVALCGLGISGDSPSEIEELVICMSLEEDLFIVLSVPSISVFGTFACVYSTAFPLSLLSAVSFSCLCNFPLSVFLVYSTTVIMYWMGLIRLFLEFPAERQYMLLHYS